MYLKQILPIVCLNEDVNYKCPVFERADPNRHGLKVCYANGDMRCAVLYHTPHIFHTGLGI